MESGPHIPMLKEHNVRVGFFGRDQFQDVLQRLPGVGRPAATFMYITGWRIDSEVLPREWRRVVFKAGEVCAWTRTLRRTAKDGRSR
jgi:hypothetical protein